MKIIKYIFIVCVFLLIGSVIGELVMLLVPQDTTWYQLLSQYSYPGFAPVDMDFDVIKLTLGVFIKINIVSLTSVVLSSLILLFKEFHS